MAILSLRGVIGLLAAASVAIVACVTLSITLTTALSALRSVGTVHATSLINNANAKTGALFSTATDALTNLDNVIRSEPWPYPSDDAATYIAFDTFMRTQTLPNIGTWTTLLTYFADNTRISYGTPVGTTACVAGDNLRWTPYSTTFPNQTLVASGKTYQWLSNFSYLSPNDPLIVSIPPTTVVRARDGYWNQALLPATLNGYSPLIAGIYASTAVSDNKTRAYVVISIPSYRYGDARVTANVYAVSIVAFNFSSISQFLGQLNGTTNTVAFAYDGNGFLIGSSIDATVPYTTVRPHTSTSVPDGCSTTDGDVNSFGASRLLCRSHITAYPYAPLQSLASSRPDFLLTPTVLAEWMSIGSANYFVAASRVRLVYPGMTVNVALIMPESDIIGDVVTGQNTAIGITCGLFVVVAIANFVLVSLLLSPLTRIADRMVDAANLEDDGTRDDPSAMSEVRQLQDAYFAMNAELIRIRSFVPQTVLAARRTDRDMDLEQDIGAGSVLQSEMTRDSGKAGGAATTSDTKSNRSTHSRRNVTTSGAPLAAPSASLTTTSVTVLSGNLCGLHLAMATLHATQISAGIAATVEAVSDAVTSRAGVFTFHGDRFLATFNAARPCGGHARKAAEAAMALSDVMPTIGLKLRMRIGIATGACLVGSVGSERVKTFSTMGAAFTQATLLERTARRYDCGVMATQRSIVDITLYFEHRYVDAVDLPAREGGLKRMLVAEVLRREVRSDAGVAASKEKEWLYVVGSEAAGRFSERNKAFELCVAGATGDARAMLAQMQDGGRYVDVRDGLEKLISADDTTSVKSLTTAL